MRIRLLTLILASATGSFSLPALGADAVAPAASSVARTTTPTHVIGFVAGDHFQEAEALNRALKKALELSTNQRLSTGDFSIEVLTAALGCKERPEASCLKKIANKISSQRFLWGTLNVEGQRIRVELHLYSEDSTDKKVTFSYQSTLSDTMDSDLVGIAANSISQLMGPLRYRAVVRSKLKTGDVWVDGTEVGQLFNGELNLELSAGDHEFQLRGKKSNKPTTDQVNASAKSTGAETSNATDTTQTLAVLSTRIQVAEQTKLRLDPESHPELPTSKPQSVTAPPKTDTRRPTPEPFIEGETGTTSTQRTWGYVGLGAGGVFIVGGAVAAASLYLLNHKESFQQYREGLLPSENACDEAKRGRSVTGAMPPDDVRSLCGQASILEIAEVVLFSTGVVAAGTGLTLILTSKTSASTPTRSVVPTVSFRRGHTDLGVTWRF